MYRTDRRALRPTAVLFAILCLCTAPLIAQPAATKPKPAKAPATKPATGKTSGPAPLMPDSAQVARLQWHVKFLASDDLAGRRTADEGNAQAAKYIAAKFQALGTVPLPGGDGYYHYFDYLAGLTVGKNNWLTLRQGENETRFPAGDRVNPLGFSSSARAYADLVFVGYGITSPDDNYDDYAGVDAEGKVVVMMRYSPDGDNPHGALTRHASFSAKVRNAVAHRVAGVIFINQPSDSAELLKPRLDRNFTNAEVPCMFAFSSVFDGIRDHNGRTFAQLQEDIDASRKPASFEVANYKAEVAVDLQLKRAKVPNVVAMIPGTDKELRDEYIVIGGHFDHLGMGGEGSLHGGHEAAIHHGADDNASGTAGVIELAGYFARTGGNRRTLVFMGFNGEEEGLLGSAAFMAKPPIAPEKIVTMVNLDMVGRLDSNLIVQGTGTSPWWPQLLDQVNAGRFTLKKVEDGFGPSDHSSFYSKGIPVLFFFTGLHSDYHRPSDTWEKVNNVGTARIISYIADMVRAVDAKKERAPFTKTQSSAMRSGGNGFKVYVGSIPDYGFEGKGLRLSGVSENGPAQKAGLKEGDVIVRMGTRSIANIYDYTDALGAFKPKDTVEVEFLRGTERMTANVVMGSR